MSAKRADLCGSKFGRLTVLRRVGSYRGESMWRCVCECGMEKTARGSRLKYGYTQSCGCFSLEQLSLGPAAMAMKRKPSEIRAVIKKLGDKKYYKENREAVCHRNKLYSAEARDGLADKYLRELLWKSGLRAEHIPQTLLSAKRAHLQLKRLIKERL